MRSTLAFVAGMLAGFLLAWAGGPALTQLAREWPASARTEALLRIRFDLESRLRGLASSVSPHEPSSISSSLRRPVTHVLRMAGVGPILAAAPASNSTVPAASADETASNASTVSVSGPVMVAEQARQYSGAEPDARPAADKVAEGGPEAASAPRPVAGKKEVRSTPQEQYARALASYQSGRYALARERFAAFMAAFPGHALVPNALYWSGETWYAQGRYDRASTFFEQVAREHPRHAKSPDALLKLAYSAMRQRRFEQAGSYLRQLEARYPESPASRLGRQARIRLHGLNGSPPVVLAHG